MGRRYYDDDDEDSYPRSRNHHNITHIIGDPSSVWGAGNWAGSNGGSSYRHRGNLDGSWQDGRMSNRPDESDDPNSPGRVYARQLIRRQNEEAARNFKQALKIGLIVIAGMLLLFTMSR